VHRAHGLTRCPHWHRLIAGSTRARHSRRHHLRGPCFRLAW
jgi:hypothetical protein